MKNIVYILVCASVIFFTACSSQDKKKDGTLIFPTQGRDKDGIRYTGIDAG